MAIHRLEIEFGPLYEVYYVVDNGVTIAELEKL